MTSQDRVVHVTCPSVKVLTGTLPHPTPANLYWQVIAQISLANGFKNLPNYENSVYYPVNVYCMEYALTGYYRRFLWYFFGFPYCWEIILRGKFSVKILGSRVWCNAWQWIHCRSVPVSSLLFFCFKFIACIIYTGCIFYAWISTIDKYAEVTKNANLHQS